MLVPLLVVGLLGAQAQFLFIPLVVRQVSDEDAKCRLAVSAVLRMLLKNVDGRTLQTLFSFLVRWFAPTERPSFRRAAAQVST